MAPTNYYVDPVGGNDTTGNGTSGTPWKSVQNALNTITRDATNGDQINVKAGGTDTLSSALVLTTYGTPTLAAPLFIRGYTSAANDGGFGIVEGGGSVSVISASGANYLWFVDMKLGNTGANRIARVGIGGGYVNCEIYNSSAAGIQTGANNLVSGCYIHDCATGIDGSAQPGFIYGCHFANGATRDFTTAIDVSLANTICDGNILNLDGTSVGIKVTTTVNIVIKNNSIFSAAGTGKGIYIASGVAHILNNIVEGFSGSGGQGIRLDSGAVASVMAANALYNNEINISNAGLIRFQPIADATLSGSAFVNAAADDFDINGTVTGVTEAAWPTTFLGASSTTPKAEVGASQTGAGAGAGAGGLLTHPGMAGGVNG